MAVVAGEAAAWSAAAPHLDLPDDLVALVHNLERVEGERAAISAQLGPVSAAEQIVAGATAAAALELDGAARQAAERAAEARHATGQALTIARRQLDSWVAGHRDDLIAAAAPPVEALLAGAVVAADALAEFGPRFNPARIAASGTSSQLAVWRDSRQVDEALSIIRAAWLSSWRSACSSAGQHRGAHRAPGYLRPGKPGGIHTWEHPWAVEDVDTRDGLNLDVLAIAAAHEHGQYRLASLAELAELHRRVPLARPQVGQERARRPVLLPPSPTTPPSQTTPRSRSRAMGV